ncbi:hypothetical protein BbiDN127_E0001 (plasmid) [Borreliella bissettiae DN127]|uniref:Uncharacterized protein n=1 Tax=Borrelia bissettiae (strain DSM 17990 / CIP 109136 / DN127) TaxID=521010 RepID=G0AP12_BORBD|nr:hypothetical protein BbiDN127_E0001 [Borreliella bissettiae DN127]
MLKIFKIDNLDKKSGVIFKPIRINSNEFILKKIFCLAGLLF